MRAFKQVLSPTRAVNSVTSALTFGFVGKPEVSGLAGMARSMNPIARFRRAPETVKSQWPNTGIVPPANERICSVRLSGIIMSVEFISQELEEHSPASPAQSEIKLLDATAQLYLTNSNANASNDAVCLADLTNLRLAFSAFKQRAQEESWGERIPDTFLDKLSARITMLDTQIKKLNASVYG